MRCTLLKIAASLAKSLFRFHLKKPFVTHCLVMLYLNKQRFVPNIDFSLTERHTVQKHICWRLFAVLPDTKRLFRQHATKRRMQKHICAALLFCSKFALRNCDWRKFRLRVQVFDTKKTICTRFSRRCKNSLRRLFASTFIWKFIFGLTFAMHFQLTARASGMSILPLPPTYVYGVCSKFTHSVHYSGVCPFNNGGIGK